MARLNALYNHSSRVERGELGRNEHQRLLAHPLSREWQHEDAEPNDNAKHILAQSHAEQRTSPLATTTMPTIATMAHTCLPS